MKIRELERPPLRILDFDTECRPMHYSEWRPESQITAYAWQWVGTKGKPEWRVMEQDMSNEDQNLLDFLAQYDAADVVMGHYIRKHDLPLLNDHCIRLGVLPISERRPKWTIDTKMDAVQIKALGMSQDNLSVTLGLTSQKHHMSGSDWRTSNALGNAGQREAIERVTSDVTQNIELYHALAARGALRPMKRWPRS